MTDQGRPLSRRERREAEARQVAQETPTTPLPEAPAVTQPDGTPLSRKERRRIERAERPLETWTAEEQMIATGQIPVMTPEALDAQEMVERDKVDGGHDAEAGGPERPVDDAPEPEVARAASVFAAAPEVEPEAVAEPEVEAVAEPSAPEDQPVEAAEAPEADEPFVFVTAESAADLEAESEDLADDQVDEPAEQPWAAATPWQPVHPVEDEPVAPEPAVEVADAETAPEEDAEAPEEDEPTAPVAEEPVDPAGASGIPDAYRHLFPTGSLQARRFEEPAAEPELSEPTAQPEAPAEPEASEPAAVAPEPVTEAPATSGADEIRRLTELAMAGIAAAQARPAEPEPEGSDEDTQVLDPAQVYAQAEPVATDAPAEDEPRGGAEPTPEVARPSLFGAGGPSLFGAPPAPEAAPATPTVSEPASGSDGTAAYAPEVDQDEQGLPRRGEGGANSSADGAADHAAPAIEDLAEPEPTADDEPAFEVEPELAPVTPSAGAAITPARLRPATAGETSTTAAPGPSVWDAHPLTQSTPRQVADYTPSQDIPIPDFTKIMHGYATTSSSAGTAPEGHVGDGPLGTETPGADQAETPRRPQPEPEEGAHHFAWAHLAVIAAVAFLLGVLVWHLTGNA